MERFLHTISRFVHGLVLPDSDHEPTGGLQPSRGILVAATIGLEFLPPPLSIVPRHGSVLRAQMPEAAVDEHRNSLTGEDDVDPSAPPVERRVDAVTETPTPEFLSERNLWCCAGSALTLHAASGV